ncbi:MAG: phosphoglycerate kinase [bacterium]
MPSKVSAFPWKTIDALSLKPGSRVLVRVDFNVPLTDDGSISDYRRIEAALPTVEWLLEKGYCPILMSHLGRPGGSPSEDLSLRVVKDPLEDRLGCRVQWSENCVGPPAEEMAESLTAGEVGFLENLRFHEGEKNCDKSFSRSLASFGDAYVNDAFGASHRRHASIAGVPEQLDEAVAGRLLESEYTTLTRIRDNPEEPFGVLLGGAKVSDKLPVLRKFLDKADTLLVGGAMAHTFFLAQGNDVGESLVESDWVSEASKLLDDLPGYDCNFVLPEDVTVEVPSRDEIVSCSVDDIPSNGIAKDIGPETQSKFRNYLNNANTVFWNGPVGVFEEKAFETGTKSLVDSLGSHPGKVVVGGGDSGAAVARFSDVDRFHHVSTGGGAAMALMQDKELPGYHSLRRSKSNETV